MILKYTRYIVLKIIDFNSCILLQYIKFMVDLSLLLYSCHVNILEQKTAYVIGKKM